MSNRVYRDRREAGQFLATKLQDYANREDVLVLGLARGGVPVAFEVALALNVALDVFVVRKLGVPTHEELAMGAIASGGKHVLNDDVIQQVNVSKEALAEVVAKEHGELKRREKAYREGRIALPIEDKLVIVVDDGLATGATMRVAIEAVREHQPSNLIVAVPAAPPEACDRLAKEVSNIVCGITPTSFGGVGAWYTDFSQTTDEEVRHLLQEAAERTNVTVNRR